MLSIAHPAGRRCPLSPPSLLHPGIPLPATLPRPSLPFLLYSRDTYMLYTCSSPTLSVHTQRSRMKPSRPTPSPSLLHSNRLRVNRCLCSTSWSCWRQQTRNLWTSRCPAVMALSCFPVSSWPPLVLLPEELRLLPMMQCWSYQT